MEKLTRPVEVIVRRGTPKFEGMSKAKTMRGWINGQISKFGKGVSAHDMELRMIFEGVLNAYDRFHPEKVIEVKANQWKGKSSIEILKQVDRLIIIKYQKPSENEEPKRIETEATKEELEALIQAIKRHFLLDEIETKKIALSFADIMGLEIYRWKDFFSNRKWHNKLTLMLNALQELGLIEYKGGKTKLLNENISIQSIL